MDCYYVYALQSLKNGRIYIGLSTNPERRLNNHNIGETKSTRPWRPWKLIFQKKIGDRATARLAEKKLKSGFYKELLKEGKLQIIDQFLSSGVAQR